MARKTRSTKREGEHPPALPSPAPVSVEEAGRLHERAVTLREEGQHAEAATCARHALIFFERVCGPDHPDVANILNNLAGICADQGDYDEAVRLAQRAVAIMESATGSPDLALLRVQSLRTLAQVYCLQGDYTAAEPLAQRALALAEATLGPDHLETAACLNDLAVLYKYTARFATALRLYRRALSITTRALGPEHPEVATLYHNLGGLEHARGRYARGEPWARRAVAVRERALGSDHPAVAADVAALAALLDAQGQDAEAEALYRRALSIFTRLYGSEHYEIAVNTNNLAALLHARGAHAEAEGTAHGFGLLHVCGLGRPAAPQQQVEGERAGQHVVVVELGSSHDALSPAVGTQGLQVKTSGQQETRLRKAQAGEQGGKGRFAPTGGASEEHPVARVDRDTAALQDRCPTLAVAEDEIVRLDERGLVCASARVWCGRASSIGAPISLCPVRRRQQRVSSAARQARRR